MATLYLDVRNAPFVALVTRSALHPRPPGHNQISLVKRVAASGKRAPQFTQAPNVINRQHRQLFISHSLRQPGPHLGERTPSAVLALRPGCSGKGAQWSGQLSEE